MSLLKKAKFVDANMKGDFYEGFLQLQKLQYDDHT